MKKRAQPKRTAPPPFDDFLRQMTGRTSAWWMSYLQRSIGRHSLTNPDDKNHDIADPLGWLHDVTRMIHVTMPREGRYDPNMRCALVTSYVFALWYFRIHRAKAFDSRRPIALRQDAYLSWLRAVQAFALIPVDGREDSAYFSQPWDDPFGPDAKDGAFV